MSEESIVIPSEASAAPLKTVEDAVFAKELDDLVRDSERIRLAHMKKAQTRNYIALTLGITAIIAAGGGFGWYFLIEGTLFKAVACVALAACVPILLWRWAGQPLKDYVAHYKIKFLPRMGHLFGGLSYYPARGISAKILAKTGIVPAHERYRAEDCFMGVYKGTRIVLSEARLTAQEKKIFHGVYVLLELAQPVFEGHTIVSSDEEAVKRWRASRWQKLADVPIDNPDYVARFKIFSSAPEKARSYATNDFLRELHELGQMFDKVPVLAALFGKKYIFISIPCAANLFEPSHIELPVAMPSQALRTKREIERILAIIDILHLYGEKAIS